MSKFNCFNLSIDNHIAMLKMNRPDSFNSMTREFWRELPEIVRDIDKNTKARVIVLSGEGKHFCAGMDLTNFVADNKKVKKDPARLREAFYQELLGLQNSLSALEECRLPTIAAIQGACVGAGIDMIAACDMSFCTKDAFFKIAEVDVGIAPDVGTLQRLVKAIPISKLRELSYSGRKFDAIEAKELNLISEIYETKTDLMNTVLKLAKKIATKSPLVTRVIKKQINFSRDHSVSDSLDYAAIWSAAAISDNDLQEAMKSYIEKKDGEFDDLEDLKEFWEKKNGLIS